MSRQRRAPLAPIQHDAQGRAICRECGDPIPAGRRAYCSLRCRRTFAIRRLPDLAAALYRHWYGTRCVGCGADEGVWEKAYREASAILSEAGCPHFLLPWKGFELHHVKPVADGGGACGIDNYQLGCPTCHGAVTAAFNRGRARRRSESGPWKAAQRLKDGHRVPLGGPTL